jgi:hypothetical protein
MPDSSFWISLASKLWAASLQKWDVISSIIAIVLASLLPYLTNTRKCLVYEVTAAGEILPTGKSGVKLRTETEALQRPIFIVIRVTLLGNDGIQASNIDQNLRIGLAGRGVKIIGGSVDEQELKAWTISPIGHTTTTLEKKALNPGEAMEIHLIVDGEPTCLWITGHILNCGIVRQRVLGKAGIRLLLPVACWYALPLLALSIVNPTSTGVNQVYCLLLAALFVWYQARHQIANDALKKLSIKCLDREPGVTSPRMWGAPDIEEK